MLFKTRSTPIVFGGPSLSEVPKSLLNHFIIKPPVVSGDLTSLADSDKPSGGCALILDGVFGNRLSITPIECMELIRSDWLLVGASSMGALRASDCSDAGMLGIGDIYFGYQFGYYKSDADVAVVYSNDYEELTYSVVHVDNILRLLVSANRITSVTARRAISLTRAIPWYERNGEMLGRKLESVFSYKDLKSFFKALENPVHHPKKQDAYISLRMIYLYYLKQKQQSKASQNML